VFVTALSAALLVIGNYLWYGYSWARPAMIGVLGAGVFPPFLTLCRVPGLSEMLPAIGGLLLPLVFIGVLSFHDVKEYCTY